MGHYLSEMPDDGYNDNSVFAKEREDLVLAVNKARSDGRLTELLIEIINRTPYSRNTSNSIIRKYGQ